MRFKKSVSLLEISVAVAILSIATCCILTVFFRGEDQKRKNKLYVTASFLAQETMETLADDTWNAGDASVPAAWNQPRAAVSGFSGATWRQSGLPDFYRTVTTVMPATVNGMSLGTLAQLTVTVDWQENNRNTRQVVITTYIASVP